MASLEAEDIAWAVLDGMRADFAATVEDIQAERNAARPAEAFDMTAPVHLDIGFDAFALALGPSSFPRVSIPVIPSGAGEPGGGAGFTSASHELNIDFVVCVALPPEAVGILPEDAEYSVVARRATLYAWRYAEAIMSWLSDNGPFAGWDPTSIKPRLDDGQASPLMDRLEANKIVGAVAGGTVVCMLDGMYTR